MGVSVGVGTGVAVTVGLGVGAMVGFGVLDGAGASVSSSLSEGEGVDEGLSVETSIGGTTGSEPLSPMRVAAKPIPATRAIATMMRGMIAGRRDGLPVAGFGRWPPGAGGVAEPAGNGEAESRSVGAAGDAERRSVGAFDAVWRRSVGNELLVSSRSVASSAGFDPPLLPWIGSGRVRGRGSSGTWSKRSVGVSSLMRTAYAVERAGGLDKAVAFVRKLSLRGCSRRALAILGE